MPKKRHWHPQSHTKTAEHPHHQPIDNQHHAKQEHEHAPSQHLHPIKHEDHSTQHQEHHTQKNHHIDHHLHHKEQHHENQEHDNKAENHTGNLEKKEPEKAKAQVGHGPTAQLSSAQLAQKSDIKNTQLHEKLFRKKAIRPERKQRIKSYLERAGVDVDTKELFRLIFNTAVGINLLLSAILILYFSVSYGITWSTIVASVIVLWSVVFALLIYGMWLIFYAFLDIRSYKRKQDVEEVLPDFLQLTAANISAGMTIDRALWFAVRPRFGVLAKEIESIAKATMSGADLKQELDKFAARYDSILLKRSISMLNEGIDAGGSIGTLLNRIALDIQEQKAMLKEMSANVTTYVIFIGFATICAAPLLFALSGVLIQVVGSLGESVGSSIKAASSAGLPLSFSGAGVTQGDFRIFAIVSLSISATFAAIMISTIKKGNAKHGMKYIPIFIFVSITLYILVQTVGGKLLGTFF